MDQVNIDQWFREGPGVELLRVERAICNELLPLYYGDVLVQVGVQREPLYLKSATRHQFLLGNPSLAGHLLANPIQLPFADASVDVLLAQHLLDFGQRPQYLIQELSRVVMPMGRLILVGFNPWSLWGVRRWLTNMKSNAGTGIGFPARRMMDWLNLLHFKIDRIEYGAFGWPARLWRSPAPDFSLGLGRKYNLPLGGIYIIVAQKLIGGLTSSRDRAHRARRFSPIKLAQPAASRDWVGSPK